MRESIDFFFPLVLHKAAIVELVIHLSNPVSNYS